MHCLPVILKILPRRCTVYFLPPKACNCTNRGSQAFSLHFVIPLYLYLEIPCVNDTFDCPTNDSQPLFKRYFWRNFSESLSKKVSYSPMPCRNLILLKYLSDLGHTYALCVMLRQCRTSNFLNNFQIIKLIWIDKQETQSHSIVIGRKVGR